MVELSANKRSGLIFMYLFSWYMTLIVPHEWLIMRMIFLIINLFAFAVYTDTLEAEVKRLTERQQNQGIVL